MKDERSYELNDDQHEWLEKMAEEHGLPDASKTLRILIDYAIQDGDADEIFTQIRCRHC